MATFAGIFLGLSAAGALAVFYSAVKVGWPNNYFTLRDSGGYGVSRGPGRYALFRAGPFFLVATATLATASRLDIAGIASLITLTLAHLAATNGRGLATTLRSGGAAIGSLISHILTGALVVTVALLAWLCKSLTAPFVPSVQDITSSLWTGLIAAVAAVYLQRVVAEHDGGVDAQEVLQKMPGDYRLWIDEASHQCSVDRTLLRAIVLVESLNRPSWVRVLERLKGRVVRRGSYGVAQTGRDRATSDRESIWILARGLSGFVVPQDRYSSIFAPPVLAKLEEHNRGESFLDACLDAHRQLVYARAGQSNVITSMGLPSIIVESSCRVGDRWFLEGDCDDAFASLLLRTKSIYGVYGSFPLGLGQALNGRRSWSHSFEVLAESCVVVPDAAIADDDDRAAHVHRLGD